MKTAYSLLAATTAFVAGTACATGTEREQLLEISAQFDELPSVDIGNCEYSYPAFKASYEALKDSPLAIQLGNLYQTHDIPMPTPKSPNHEPSEQQCMDSLKGTQAVIDRNRAVIERMSNQPASNPVNGD